MKVKIGDLNRADVLLYLYNNAQYAGKEFASQPMLKIAYRMNPLGKREIAVATMNQAIETNFFYFDYVDLGAGPRRIGVDLSGSDFDPTCYDDTHGHDGYAARIIEKLMADFLLQIKLEFEFELKKDAKKPEDKKDSSLKNASSSFFSKSKIEQDKRFTKSSKLGVLYEASSYTYIDDEELKQYGFKQGQWVRRKEGIYNIVIILDLGGACPTPTNVFIV